MEIVPDCVDNRLSRQPTALIHVEVLVVEYVEEERQMQRDRQALEQRRAEASLFTRAKWWAFGMSPERDDKNGET